jgi:hypothetical protein
MTTVTTSAIASLTHQAFLPVPAEILLLAIRWHAFDFTSAHCKTSATIGRKKKEEIGTDSF